MEELGLDAPPEAQDEGLAPGGQLSLAADLTVETLSAPNVLGIVRGRDRRLRNEYVLVSAHMDGLGVGFAVDGDSIYNGADDNASGTAAILEVAEAMAELKDEGPRRSVAFLAVSGEDRGLLGSAWFVEHPPIPLERIVANVNIDMVGRNWEDTIAVVGKPYSSLGALVDSVAMAHPELGLTTVDDQWPADGFFFRSDHFNFARKGIPAVFFFNGVHADYHRPSDEVDKVKFEKASRIARLVYEVALAIANADDPPTWDPEARRRIVEGEQ
jgi:Zn-dependent M28 family amino/carboxypeptidase